MGNKRTLVVAIGLGLISFLLWCPTDDKPTEVTFEDNVAVPGSETVIDYNYFVTSSGNLISGVPIMRRVGTQTLHVSTIGELATAMKCSQLIGETTHLALTPEIRDHIIARQVWIDEDGWTVMEFKRPTDSDSDSLDEIWAGP